MRENRPPEELRGLDCMNIERDDVREFNVYASQLYIYSQPTVKLSIEKWSK